MAATLVGVKASLAIRTQGVLRESNGAIVLSEGFRFRWEQEIFWDLYINHGGALAARPGTSEHEFGLAVDLKILRGDAYNLRRDLAKRWGLKANVKGEDWHFIEDPKKPPVPRGIKLYADDEVPTIPKDRPMYLPEDAVAVLPTATQKGAWILKRNGGIQTVGDASFYGSPHNTPMDERPNVWPDFIDIREWNGGYVCCATNGSLWHYNAEVFADLKRRGLA